MFICVNSSKFVDAVYHCCACDADSSLTTYICFHSPVASSAITCTWLSPPEIASILPTWLQLTFQRGTCSGNAIVSYFHGASLLPLLFFQTLQVISSEQLAIISYISPILLHQATSRTQSSCAPRTVYSGFSPSASLSDHRMTLWSFPPETSLLGGIWNLPPAAYCPASGWPELKIAGSVDGPQLIPLTPSTWATNSCVFTQLQY